MSADEKESMKQAINELREVFTNDPKELQKKYQDEYFEKYKSEIDVFKHCWRLDDKEWLAQRKHAWETIVDLEKREDPRKFSKSYWDRLGRYFIKASPRKSDDRLYTYIQLAMTPFENPAQLTDHFETLKASNKKQVHEKILTFANNLYRSVPEEFYRVRLIADALYNSNFLRKTEPQGHARREKLVVMPPESFIWHFMSTTRNHLNRSYKGYLLERRSHKNNPQFYTGNERSFVEATIDYFLESVEFLMEERAEDLGNIVDIIAEGCETIELYDPDIENKEKDRFVAEAKAKILGNSLIEKIRGSVSENEDSKAKRFQERFGKSRAVIKKPQLPG